MFVAIEPSHGDAVATGFPERRCEDLDDPKPQRDGRDLGERVSSHVEVGQWAIVHCTIPVS